MPELPSGTVTFLFTDVEGSTKLWERYPQAMEASMARHDELLRGVMESSGGFVFKTIGDAFCVAFPSAPHALEAALAAQRALLSEAREQTGPLRTRMALHTGSAEERAGDYFGAPVNRIARLLSAGHGGQILLSSATKELVRDALPEGASLRDLGEGARCSAGPSRRRPDPKTRVWSIRCGGVGHRAIGWRSQGAA